MSITLAASNASSHDPGNNPFTLTVTDSAGGSSVATDMYLTTTNPDGGATRTAFTTDVSGTTTLHVAAPARGSYSFALMLHDPGNIATASGTAS